MTDIDIEIVSDVICPWCLIGTRRLEQALALRPDVKANVVFRPFLLDPTTPPEGADLRERLKKKYGVEPQTMFARVEEAARKSGIALDFTKITRTPSTVRAHALLGLALDAGTQVAVKHALLDAYFLHGEDIGSVEVLARIGAENGLDAEAVRACVQDEAALAEVRMHAEQVRRRGVTGVPFFIFDHRFAVSGAQEPSALVSVLDRITAPSASPVIH